MVLMYRIIQGFIGIGLTIFTFRSRDTFPTTRGHQYKVPVYYNVRANCLPAELPTCGTTYHQKSSIIELYRSSIIELF